MAKVEALEWNAFFQSQSKPKHPHEKVFRKVLISCLVVTAGVTLFHALPSFAAGAVAGKVVTTFAMDPSFQSQLSIATKPIKDVIFAFGHEAYFVFISWGAIEALIGKPPKKLRPDFGLFDARAKLMNPVKIEMAMRRHPATLIPFDAIMINGRSLCAEKLLDRKRILSRIVTSSSALMLPTYAIGHGETLFDWTLEHQWEGIVAKNASSRYRINRRPDKLDEAWVKRKHTEKTEAIILGYQVNPFALLVGLQKEDSPMPASVGLVEFGFSHEEKIAFRGIAQQIHTTKRKNIQMIEPLLKCKVEYLERTNNGSLRLCTFRGFVS